MSEFFLSQLLVSITLIIECFAMQFKNKNHILALLSLSCLFNGAHYLLLAQKTAGYIFLFSSVRFLISIKWKFQWIAVGSLCISLFITAHSYNGFLSILSFLATVFTTLGSFSANDKYLRIMMILGGILWIIHNTLLWSPISILVELIFVGGGAISFYRYYIAEN